MGATAGLPSSGTQGTILILVEFRRQAVRTLENSSNLDSRLTENGRSAVALDFFLICFNLGAVELQDRGIVGVTHIELVTLPGHGTLRLA